jgi:hypothetical protein
MLAMSSPRRALFSAARRKSLIGAAAGNPLSLIGAAAGNPFVLLSRYPRRQAGNGCYAYFVALGQLLERRANAPVLAVQTFGDAVPPLLDGF